MVALDGPHTLYPYQNSRDATCKTNWSEVRQHRLLDFYGHILMVPWQTSHESMVTQYTPDSSMGS